MAQLFGQPFQAQGEIDAIADGAVRVARRGLETLALVDAPLGKMM